MESLQLVLHLATIYGWDVQQVDIKTAYLYSELPTNEVIYMEQLRGFEELDKEDWVWELQ